MCVCVYTSDESPTTVVGPTPGRLAVGGAVLNTSAALCTPSPAASPRSRLIFAPCAQGGVSLSPTAHDVTDVFFKKEKKEKKTKRVIGVLTLYMQEKRGFVNT